MGDHSAEMRHKSTEVKRQLERLNNEGDRVEQQNNEREIRYCRLYDQVSFSIELVCMHAHAFQIYLYSLRLNSVVSVIQVNS